MSGGVETWENASKTNIGVNKLDRFGKRTQEVVQPGRKITLTSDERRLNMDLAWSPDVDPFTNGKMVAVRLVDGEPDNEEIEANPNMRTDEELREMLDLHWKKFDAALEEIDNPTAIQRMLEIAEDENADVTVRKLNSLRDRIQEIAPELYVADPDGSTVQAYGEQIRPLEQRGVTPN